MRITPLDIRKQPFRMAFRGYDPDQVTSFLQMVAGEFEQLIRSSDESATKLKLCEEQLDHYRKIEKTLNEALLSTQRATDEARVNAQKESELIIKDAQIRASRMEDEARNRVHVLESEIVSLKNQRDSFLARFRAMLKTQLELLTTISEDLGKRPAAGKSRMDLAEDETMDEVAPQPNVDVIGDGLNDDN
jgi:cell division initiation protein